MLQHNGVKKFMNPYLYFQNKFFFGQVFVYNLRFIENIAWNLRNSQIWLQKYFGPILKSRGGLEGYGNEIPFLFNSLVSAIIRTGLGFHNGVKSFQKEDFYFHAAVLSQDISSIFIMFWFSLFQKIEKKNASSELIFNPFCDILRVFQIRGNCWFFSIKPSEYNKKSWDNDVRT